VLAKLLTVDGAGQGVDADLLDGRSSELFPRRGTHTGGAQGGNPVNWYTYLFRTVVANESISIGSLRIERTAELAMRVCVNVATNDSAAVVVYAGTNTGETKTVALLTNASQCTGDITLAAGRDFRVAGAGSVAWGFPNYQFNTATLPTSFQVIGFGA
jgi:hypothetical protein